MLQALSLATPRSRSAGETQLRLLWRLEAGLPSPEVNPVIHDRRGNLLAMADLLDPEAGLAGEFDGALHRDPRQHADDNAREEWMEQAGLIVVRATGRDLGPQRTRTVARLRAARRRAPAWEVDATRGVRRA